jgi:hypothetical protein
LVKNHLANRHLTDTKLTNTTDPFVSQVSCYTVLTKCLLAKWFLTKRRGTKPKLLPSPGKLENIIRFKMVVVQLC